jgi:apolipoprotein N-acyltransferase
LQHLDYARLRAIECRRAVARSANTGVSCFINQRGDVVRAAGVGEETVLVGTMHANDAVTPYMRHGDLLGRTALWITAGLLLLVLSSWLTGGFLLSRPDAPRAGLRPKAFRG